MNDDITGQLLEIPAATGWVVHELLQSRQSQGVIWAWCKVSEEGPGYTRIVYTRNDGVTEVDNPPNTQLGPVVVKLFC